MLVQAAERGGWVFLRTVPRKDASLELEGVGPAETEPLGSPGPNDQYADALAGLAPSTRPICRWLVREGALTEKRAAAAIQTLGFAADEEIIATAYDRLARSARDAVKRLSLVRPAWSPRGERRARFIAAALRHVRSSSDVAVPGPYVASASPRCPPPLLPLAPRREERPAPSWGPRAVGHSRLGCFPEAPPSSFKAHREPLPMLRSPRLA